MSDRYARRRLAADAADERARIEAAECRGQIRALRSMARWLRKNASSIVVWRGGAWKPAGGMTELLPCARECERRARKLEKEKA